MRERLADSHREVDDALRVLAGVAVTLLERRRQRRDHVAVPGIEDLLGRLRAPEDGGLPAAAGSRLLERRARRREQRLGLLGRLEPRDPDRDRDPASAARFEILELDEDPLDRCGRSVSPCLREEKCELVPSHPAGEVVYAGLLGDEVPDRDQHGIPGRVTVLEVEVAEAVDVDQRDGERSPVAVGPGDVELQLGAKRHQAEQAPSQRIALLEPREIRFELGDALPCVGKSFGQAFPIPREHRSEYRLARHRA